jgi:hypothetical protein
LLISKVEAIELLVACGLVGDVELLARMMSCSNPARALKTWKDQLPAAGHLVDAFLETSEADFPFLEPPHSLNEVPDAAAQAVELPDDKSVTLPEVCEGLIEPWPRGTGTTGLVREELLAAGAIQGVGLEIEALFKGGDACIAEQHGHHPHLGRMAPKLKSYVKVTGC